MDKLKLAIQISAIGVTAAAVVVGTLSYHVEKTKSSVLKERLDKLEAELERLRRKVDGAAA